MHLVLTRHGYLTTCTLGAFQAGALRIQTLERPWLPNPAGAGGLPGLSCVPDGVYDLFAHSSAKFTDVYAISNPALGVYYQQKPRGQAWGRTAILLHISRTVRGVIGCIGIGLDARIIASATLGGEHVLERGDEALEALRRLLGRTARHSLEIRPSSGTAEPL